MARLQETLMSDMKDAMRARDAERLNTIRFTLSALKNAQIDAMHPLDAAEETQVLRKQAKQRRDSIEQFRKGNRDDLADKEQAELVIIESYLPAAPSVESMREAVRAAIALTGATGPKQMSDVMKATMAALGSEADGRQVQGLVREELAALGG